MRSIAVRFGQMLFVLWAVATLLFFMFRLMPGDPTLAYIDTTFTAEQQQALRQQFGLDRSLPEQYFIYFGNALRGEFGTSFRMKAPVFDIIFAVLPNTHRAHRAVDYHRLYLRRARRRLARLEARLVDRGRRNPSRADPARGARSSGSAWCCSRSSPSGLAGFHRAAPIRPARSFPRPSRA